MDNVLIGDYVILYGTIDSKKGSVIGTLCSSGFSNSNVYAESIKPFLLDE